MGMEKYDKWDKVTVNELCAYMGFMLLMGIVHLPSLYDYWRNDEVFHYAPIASKISRNRFLELHRYLHFTAPFHHQGVHTTTGSVRSDQ